MTAPEPASEAPNPTEISHWRPLRLMLAAMDQDIASLYEEAGVPGVRPRFVGPLIQLGRHYSMTIKELAESLEVTHSAMSQTVAAMRRASLVQGDSGRDARTRRIRLTDTTRELLPLLEAEWRATEAAVAELESEIPYPLGRAVQDINEALAHRSFRERLDSHLAAPARRGTVGPAGPVG